MPKVSAIIPIYGSEKQLFERLENITNQSMVDLEIIVVFTTLGEDTNEKLLLLAQTDGRIHLLKVEENISLYSMWKEGIKQAKGDYVWIADINNRSALTFLQEGCDILATNNSANGVMFDSILLDEQQHPINLDFDHWKHRHIQSGSISIFNTEQWTTGMQYWHNFVYSASSMIARRAAITNDILITLDNPFTGAWEFWTALGYDANIIEVHKRLNHHQVGASPIDPSENTLPYSNRKEQCLAFKEEAKTIGIFSKRMSISFINREVRRLKLMKKVYSAGLTGAQQKALRKFIYSAY